MRVGVVIMQVESEMYGGDWDFVSKGWNEKCRIEFTFVELRGEGGRGETKNNDLAQGGGNEGNEIERTSEREARTPPSSHRR